MDHVMRHDGWDLMNSNGNDVLGMNLMKGRTSYESYPSHLP